MLCGWGDFVRLKRDGMFMVSSSFAAVGERNVFLHLCICMHDVLLELLTFHSVCKTCHSLKDT